MRSICLLLALPLLAFAQSEQADLYAPLNATCPKDLAVIDAKGLSNEEVKWREGRLKKVHEALGSYLENAKIPDFNISEFTKKLEAKDAPVVSLAISGGGTQSGVAGLGIWQAFDIRYPPAREAGTGGLTQLLILPDWLERRRGCDRRCSLWQQFLQYLRVDIPPPVHIPDPAFPLPLPSLEPRPPQITTLTLPAAMAPSPPTKAPTGPPASPAR